MTKKPKHYFAGGNTPSGFADYFEGIVPRAEAEHFYCIKGGPGVGKSTFMKRAGERCEKEGYTVEYFHCPSDPRSLDGVFIKELKVAYVDGTAPHIKDPEYPGAVDTIIDFGAFFNTDELKKNRKEIICLTDAVSERFANAKSKLKPVGIIFNNVERIYEKDKNSKNIISLCHKLASDIFGDSRGTNGGVRKLFLTALTPDGIINYAGETLKCEKTYILDAVCGDCSKEIMKYLADEAARREIYAELFYCPLDPFGKIDHIYLPGSDTAITVSNSYHLNMGEGRRYDLSDCFYGGTDKEALSRAMETVDELLAKCEDELYEAREMHSRLEKYYMGAMDYEKATAAAMATLEKHLSNQ